MTNFKIIRRTHTKGKLHCTIVTNLEIFDAGLLTSHPRVKTIIQKSPYKILKSKGLNPHTWYLHVNLAAGGVRSIQVKG